MEQHDNTRGGLPFGVVALWIIVFDLVLALAGVLIARAVGA